MFDELIRQFKRTRAKTTLSLESRRHARKKTGQARVSPQHVQIVEEFGYKRRSGRWTPTDDLGTGRGTISVITSIDDKNSLDTPGRLDVRALRIADRGRPRTYGSFLSFHNHGMTDIEQLIADDGGFDAIRLVAPAEIGRPAEQPPELGLRATHALAAYEVEQPPRQPIDAELVVAEFNPPKDGLHHSLYLILDIKLYLPDMGDRPTPRIETVELDWPWLDDSAKSVEVFRFEREDYENPRGFENIKDHGWTELETAYDTTKQAITSRPESRADGRCTFVPTAGGREHTYFYSLLIEPIRPLQLINTYWLTCRILVTFDSLLSGTIVRPVHATGYPDEETPVRPSTLLEATVDLDLEQVMSERLSEHRNILRFPGVQPTRNVIDTIRTTVLSCGYRLRDETLLGSRDNDFDRTIDATRLAEGERVDITLRVIGHERRVDRTLRGAGGPRLKEELDAGDVEIELSGNIEGDHRLLTKEMNTLHASLRSRLATFAEA